MSSRNPSNRSVVIAAPGVLRIVVYIALGLLQACALPQSLTGSANARGHWMQKARAGDARAQYELAKTYGNSENARKWYCRSAVQGYLPAQIALADLYSDRAESRAGQDAGPRPRADFSNAYLWYTVAAARGDERALVRRQQLGNMMSPQDVVTAKRDATRWKQVVCEP